MDLTQLSVRVARRLGVDCDQPVVLSEGVCTIVHLRPLPIVARVTRVAHLVRPVEQVAATVALARALPGLAVSPTDLIDPGPHVEDGRYVTFWEHVERGPATPSEAGASLKKFHEAAGDFVGGLRSFDPRPEAMRIANLIEGPEGEILRTSAAAMACPVLTVQAIHGDAHGNNVLAGGLWIDMDEACRGPAEWDLACHRHRLYIRGEMEQEITEALEAYGPFDEKAVAALAPLVVLFTAAWGSIAPLVGEAITPHTQQRLDWLKTHYPAGG